MAGTGRLYKFHGAFGSKREAVRKEAARRGSFIKPVTIRGSRRWLVMTPR